MAEEWYYLKGDQQIGPIAREAMREAAMRGEVTGETYVWSEGMDQWSLAREVPGLLPAGGATPAYPGQAVQPPQPPQAWPTQAPHGQYPSAVPYASNTYRPKPDSHLMGAILTLIFCCLPFGVVAIVYAAQVDSKYAHGDYAGSERASSSANMWMWLAFGLGLVFHAGWGFRRAIH